MSIMATFHLFPRLPLETQMAIWEEAMEGRQVRFGAEHIESPKLMNICRTSRDTLQRHYIRLCVDGAPSGDSPKDNWIRKHGRRYTWFNYDIDTLYLDQFQVDDFIDTRANLEIRRMRVEHTTCSRRYREHDQVRPFKVKNEKYFPKLKYIEIINVQVPTIFRPPSFEWRRAYYGLMISHYAVDEPVTFDIEVSSANFQDMEPLTRYNYEKIKEWEDKHVEHDDFFPENQVYGLHEAGSRSQQVSHGGGGAGDIRSESSSFPQAIRL